MLIIRRSQMGEFARQSLLSFAPELLAHAAAYHPERSAALGGWAAQQEFVNKVIEAALAYHLQDLRSAARLFDLAILFGLPLPYRMDQTMRNTALGEPKRRLDRAWKEALFRLEASR